MNLTQDIINSGQFSITQIEQLFVELVENNYSMMIRSDTARSENLYTCAITSSIDEQKSARRDAPTINEAVVLCLTSYFIDLA